jgi:regulatory protein
MDKKITGSERKNRRQDVYTIILSDGTAFDADIMTVAKYGLYKGAVIAAGEEEKILHAASVSLAKNYALNLLDRKMYTESELRKKLRGKKYGERQISSVLSDLRKSGIVDDARYAELYFASLLRRKKYSLREIRKKMLNKGLNAELVEEALGGEEVSELYQAGIIRKLAEKKWFSLSKDEKDKRKIKEKTFQFLARKGFDFDKINFVLAELEKEEIEE